VSPGSTPSSRVRLEVALLDADQAAPSPAPSPDERPCLTALVVAAELDVRRYVRECLRERADVRLAEAASVAAAVALAAQSPPEFLVVDAPERDVVAALSSLRAIVIVDDVLHDAFTSGTRLRLLARPFTAEALIAEVDRILGSDGSI
jgi:hypothetical protein